MQETSRQRHGEVLERVGTIVGTQGAIPCAVWSRASDEPAHFVVCIGHGASGDKHESYVIALARYLVSALDCAVLAIDGPVHGARRGSSDVRQPLLAFAAEWSSNAALTDDAVNDWRTALDAVVALPEVADDATVGFWGLSMGTILGLPFVAAEPRVEACVLGLMGTTGPTKERIVHDAQRVTVPTMFLVQWDDSLFRRDTTLALFDTIGAVDKVLVTSPGEHGAVPEETFRRSADFLVDRLTKARYSGN